MNKENRKTVDSRFLEACDISQSEFPLKPFVMVIFGGAGDLSKRKLIPSLYHLYKQQGHLSEFAVIGFGLPELDGNEYRDFVIDSLKEFAGDYYEDKSAIEFSSNFKYCSSALDKVDGYKHLGQGVKDFFELIGGENNLLYYCAVPPQFINSIVDNLYACDMCKGICNSKIIIEKPFGTDINSAVELNKNLAAAFDEKQIYRMDHYLGKDTVQNILFFRFGNSIFEPLWNRRYIDHIQITVAEDIGIGNRAGFYEKAGVVKDIVQNHIMQLIALVAMEPPVGFEADLIRDEKVKVFRTIRPMNNEYIKNNMLRGQYSKGVIANSEVLSYREEDGVDPESNTPTFFAGKFYIDNWRWAGIPFYARVGKRMSKRYSQIVVQFNQPPLRLFGRSCDILKPNALVFSLQPNEEICLGLSVKSPGVSNQPYTANMDFNYEKTFNVKQFPAYERLLIDCIKGDLTLFARQDGVEAMWSVVDQITKYWGDNPAVDFPNYEAGTDGPTDALNLLSRDGREWYSRCEE